MKQKLIAAILLVTIVMLAVASAQLKDYTAFYWLKDGITWITQTVQAADPSEARRESDLVAPGGTNMGTLSGWHWAAPIYPPPSTEDSRKRGE